MTTPLQQWHDSRNAHMRAWVTENPRPRLSNYRPRERHTYKRAREGWHAAHDTEHEAWKRANPAPAPTSEEQRERDDIDALGRRIGGAL